MCCVGVVLMFSSLVVSARAADTNDPAIGRWDITLGDGPTPCWLEITKKDGQYAGRFLLVAASVFDLKSVKVDGTKIEFATVDTNGDDRGITFAGTVEGNTIKGETVSKDGGKGKWTAQRFVAKPRLDGVWTIDGQGKGSLRLRQTADRLAGVLMGNGDRPTPLTNVAVDGYALSFTAGEKQCKALVKGNVMDGTLGEEKFTAKREVQWGKPVELFNGKDLAGWKPLGDPNNYKWKVVDGIMHCDGHGSSNIVTEQKFEDFKLHVEFKVPEGGNSGVYLRGRYEIQVADSAGHEPDAHNCGGLYSRIAPKETACTKAGEWQTFDITLIDHYVTVVHNGKTIIDNQEIEGITGGAIDSREDEPGPIYLQGDHTAVDYRKITLTPARTRPGGRVSG